MEDGVEQIINKILRGTVILEVRLNLEARNRIKVKILNLKEFSHLKSRTTSEIGKRLFLSIVMAPVTKDIERIP